MFLNKEERSIMTKSDEKLIVVLVNKHTGEIVAYKEVPAEHVTKPYHIKIKEIENQLVRESYVSSSSTKFFTGMATSIDALISGYPEMKIAR